MHTFIAQLMLYAWTLILMRSAYTKYKRYTHNKKTHNKQH